MILGIAVEVLLFGLPWLLLLVLDLGKLIFFVFSPKNCDLISSPFLHFTLLSVLFLLLVFSFGSFIVNCECAGTEMKLTLF